MPFKIVFLDDELDICEIFSENFSSDKIEVKTFSKPEEAIAYIQQNRPDIVFLDYRMPKLNGDMVAARLDPNLPKVLVTGDLEVELKSNFIRRFPKPFPWSEMEMFLEEFISRRVA